MDICPSQLLSFSGIRFALFDLDRTLVRVNTSSLWTRYRHELARAGYLERLRVALWTLEYSLGIIDAPSVAEQATRPYRGLIERELVAEIRAFVEKWVVPQIGATARLTVRHHRELGHELAIVTSAIGYVARPVAELLGIEHVVSSELEVDGGRLTGRVRDPLCYSTNKLNLTRRWLLDRAGRLEEAVFYSDSSNDAPLLRAVGVPIRVNPDPRLRFGREYRAWLVQKWT